MRGLEHYLNDIIRTTDHQTDFKGKFTKRTFRRFDETYLQSQSSAACIPPGFYSVFMPKYIHKKLIKMHISGSFRFLNLSP